MSDSANAPLIVLAAGGTGGHVFPAEALARELLGRGLHVALITDSRGGKFSDDLSIPTYRIRVRSLGKSLFSKIRSLLEMGIGLLQARIRLKQLKPAAVVGFGGYPSVPTLYAAAQLNIPIVLHDSNAILGRANRLMVGKAKVLATAFPHVVGLKAGGAARLVQTGNPVRPAFAAGRATPYAPPLLDGPFRILVLGGSQGARVFSHVVPQAVSLMPVHLRRRIALAQQCRKENLDDARAGFAGAGIEVELSPFFSDVPERMAKAHLVICRSGGSTIAELTAIGRPALFVPLPYGHAGEQIANAEAVAEAGGGWLIPEASFTPETLAIRLETLMAMPELLLQTAAAARTLGKITAAENLADCVTGVIEGLGEANN